ncbi:SLAP domain-containing protein [Psychrobacillus sp. FSL H8-0483]|uniref:SLAP domain-containing protein n=1 Tax=Psychrobacillus sp. FSL H8-0483 TaxID=2921389 RepID=UPI00315AD61B
MQKLEFESSWAKALSSKDREEIEKTFLETSNTENHDLLLSPIWQAINHKGELLITVLVHNFTQQAIAFNQTKLAYIENNKIIAEYTFTLPTLSIQPKVSMPWTFIFSVDSLKSTAKLNSGSLEIV